MSKPNATPSEFMREIRTQREARQRQAGSGFTQQDMAAHLGMKFQSYSDYELGRTRPDHDKAELILGKLVPEADQDRYRQMDGYPKVVERSSAVLAEIGARLFPGEPVLPLGELLESVRLERQTNQANFVSTVLGSKIKKGEADPGRDKLQEIIGSLGYGDTQAEFDRFYTETRALADTLAVRRQCFGDALFVMRYREGGAGVGGSLATPVPHKDTYVGAVMGFKEVEAALTERQHPISDGHLKRFEKGAAIPNREDALAVAAIFGFPDEASFYQAAHDLRVAHPHFPERPISGVSAQAAQFGRRAQTLRNVLGMTQEDIHQLEPDLSLGTISSIEKGERKTAVSPQIMDGFQHALGTPTPDSFEGRASDGKHVLEVRRANFNAALKLLREVLDVNQDELGRRAKAEYERMEAELGIPLPPNRFESGQMGPWANNVVPAHPVVIAALVRAAGAQNEADFYQKAGMGADEVRPEVFQRVGEYVEGYYAAAKTAALTGTGPQNLSIFTGGDDVETWRARLAQSSQGQVKGNCPDKY